MSRVHFNLVDDFPISWDGLYLLIGFEVKQIETPFFFGDNKIFILLKNAKIYKRVIRNADYIFI